jgi:hypothetical protein
MSVRMVLIVDLFSAWLPFLFFQAKLLGIVILDFRSQGWRSSAATWTKRAASPAEDSEVKRN